MCKGYSSVWAALGWILFSYYLDLRDFLRRMRARWLVVFLVLPFLGCATLQAVSTNPVFQNAVQGAVLEYVLDSEDKQSVGLQIVDKLQAHVDTATTVTVSDLEKKTLQEIPWAELSFKERAELRAMISAIAENLRLEVGKGSLDKDERVRVQTFLNWVDSALHFAQK